MSGVDDTIGTRAARAAGDTVEFRVDTATQLATLELGSSSARRWMIVIAALLALNWLHDLGATVEMLDWLDGRDSGFMSDEFSHDVSVIMPLLLVVIPIWWGRRRDKQARLDHAKNNGGK